ncbi:MAG TPA: Flp pilus assembly protein CpaB [Lentisphaeria bacterium]|nr:MAG: Flp pilus assembly protein CpaB [Lentisphaerae bacterium GWF2_49_21]HBC85406.1 Flp pilus assembly protein CpaB [Lentisphaeria bacterium]
MKQKLLLVAALFFGVLAFILTYYQIKIEREKALGAATTVKLIKLKATKAEDEQLNLNDFEEFETKRFNMGTSKNPEIEWKDRFDIVNKKTDSTIVKGDILKWYQIRTEKSAKGEGLAGIIADPRRNGAPMRAVSVPVDTTSSVTNLVKPGHHVDIVGTFRFPEMKGDKSLDTITMTILQNVLVLATGQQTANSVGPESKTAARSYSTVTLELFPKEVEMIIFASQKGRLTLSLRNYEDSIFVKDYQSVNFKFLEENIQKYSEDRERRLFGSSSSIKSKSR